MPKRRPMPAVEYDGQVYRLTSRKTEIPDLRSMDRLSALLWLNANTRARGYTRRTNPLAGFGGAVRIEAA